MRTPRRLCRRSCLRQLAIGTAGFVAACGNDRGLPVIDGSPHADAPPNACAPDLCVDVATTPPLQAVGGSFVVTAPGDRIVVVRVSAATFITVSDVCTHVGCAVGFSAALDHFLCPCHGSEFGLDGAVLHGPATRPLRSYANSYDEATQIITIAGAG
jgi:cytochrome b6-f complex iron-sulfur subunit